jgi:Protein of unknown function (DUF2917)
MSTIEILRRWLRALVPGFLAPQPAALPAERDLAPGDSARYDDASGRALCCLAGSLWITHDRDPKDVFVEAGETYYVASRERMIVHALREGMLRIL